MYCLDQTDSFVVQDWSRHRLTCIPHGMRTASHCTSRPLTMYPGEKMVKGYVFWPERGGCVSVVDDMRVHCPSYCADRPTEVYIGYVTSTTSDSRGGRPVALLSGFFGSEQPGELVLNAGVGGAPIRSPLSVWFSPTCARAYAPENRSVEVLAGRRSVGSPWYGPAVVLKYSGSRCSSYVDMTALDLTNFSAYFLLFQ